MRQKIYLLMSLLTLTFAFSACSDFLDQDSEHVVFTDKDHLNNATDTIYSVTGIMNKLQDIADRTILLGEMRGDLVDVTDYTSADLQDVASFNIGDDNVYNNPRDYYAIINNCNYFLANADTTLKNNRNEYIFMKEYAAVKAFRAWTYLQLVLNYGEVPFVTDPILTKEEADKEYPRANLQQVCEYFITDLEPYVNIETPTYGNIRNTDSKLFYFPIQILLGDLNLWSGNYREAAQWYYSYITSRNGSNSSYPISTNAVRWNRDDVHWARIDNSWSLNSFMMESSNRNAELITMIPGDSIPSEGNYSELRNLFNTNENNQYQASIVPSQAIVDLSAAQKYCHITKNRDIVFAPEALDNHRGGDLRLSSVWSTANMQIKNRRVDLSQISKYSTRNVHVYRRTMVYLRLAEALNCAGYPRFAFAILKSGVNDEVIERDVVPYYTADSTWIRQFRFSPNYYILETMLQSQNENTIGIHSHGSGFSTYNDTYVMPYDESIEDSLDQIAYQMEAVEDLIMDEEALEFAFEGYRFYDLMRVALRRGDPSYLADRVYGRRGEEEVETMKGFIKSDLNDPNNWYLKWNGQIGLGY